MTEALPTDERQKLATELRNGRVAAGWTKRAAFARDSGINDSTLQIIEGMRAGNASVDMLDRYCVMLGWPVGTWRTIADGGVPPPVRPRGSARPETAPPSNPLAEVPDSALLAELLHRAALRERRVDTPQRGHR